MPKPFARPTYCPGGRDGLRMKRRRAEASQQEQQAHEPGAGDNPNKPHAYDTQERPQENEHTSMDTVRSHAVERLEDGLRSPALSVTAAIGLWLPCGSGLLPVSVNG